MTRYDKIWAPTGKFSEMKNVMEAGNIMVVGHLGPIENVIVLTIEEAKDLWNAGRQHLKEALKAERTDEPELIVSPNFETYLTSKGITL